MLLTEFHRLWAIFLNPAFPHKLCDLFFQTEIFQKCIYIIGAEISFSELYMVLLKGVEALELGGIVHTPKYSSKFEGYNLKMFSSAQWEIYSGKKVKYFSYQSVIFKVERMALLQKNFL